MNAIADIFKALPLSSGIFLEAEFSAPWCINAYVGPEDCAPFVPVPDAVTAFHYVYDGGLTVAVEGEGVMHAEAGDILILPRNDVHLLGSDVGLVPVNTEQLIQPGKAGELARIRLGGGGTITRVICGYLGSDRHYFPVLNMLPAVMKVSVSDAVTSAWFDSAFKRAAQERMFHEDGTGHSLAKLTELLFLDAMQQYLQSQPEESFAWFAALGDPKILKALSLLQTNMKYRWTTEELAREVGLSRSAFAVRFSELLGQPPMRYLTMQRLQSAARRLKNTQDSLTAIAFESGYESEAAFTRAFKREYGFPPAAWRNWQKQGG